MAWTVPAGWSQELGESMRFATLRPAGEHRVEIAVTRFPGDVGGKLANINRWRAQLQLEPITAEQIDDATDELDIGGVQATILDITNQEIAQAMVAVMIPEGGQTWFFKLSGPLAEVAEHKGDLMKLVQSVRFPGAP